MAGRLIFPFLAEIAQLDIQGTAADPDGAGPLQSGYDEIYRETQLISSMTSELGVDARVEKALVRVPAQFHTGPTIGDLMALKETTSGNVATASVQVLMMFSDLDSLGLVDSNTGTALIKIGDRLSAVYTLGGELVQQILTPPGLYVTKAVPIYGLKSVRSLLEVTFESRDTGQMESV